MKKKLIILSVILICAILLGVTKGSVNISLNELLLENNRPIFLLRILRVIIAIIAGCGLSVSGIALQAILRNPLAEPYLLGTSSGAGLGAVIAIIAGISAVYMPLAAFLGAALSVILVYGLSRQNNKISEQSLILSGVIISIAFSALIVFLVSVSGNEALHGLSWWLWGSLQAFDLKLISMAALIVSSGIAVIFVFSQDLNAISIGEEEALHLGINAEQVKKIIILVVSLVSAGIVSICGIIGFVGLIIPHMMRFIFGPNHKKLIPATCLASSVFMIICDVISRTLFAPVEVPIGVITAIIGTPVFIFLLKRKL